MSTQFLKTANLGRIHDYILQEFHDFANKKKEAQLKLRKSCAIELLDAPYFNERHQPLFDWIEKNPQIKLEVSGFYTKTLIEKIADAEAAFMYPDLVFKVDIAKDAVIAYLHFMLPEDREAAINLVLNKYYAQWPEFISNFKMV